MFFISFESINLNMGDLFRPSVASIFYLFYDWLQKINKKLKVVDLGGWEGARQQNWIHQFKWKVINIVGWIFLFFVFFPWSSCSSSMAGKFVHQLMLYTIRLIACLQSVNILNQDPSIDFSSCFLFVFWGFNLWGGGNQG